MSVNRQTILSSVYRQLRESLAETGEVRPLGEIVPRVAGEIRVDSTSPVATTSSIIPVEKVAAFVDGRLGSEEADAICRAVMVDNSVLAEIIAAVRATQAPLDQLPPLSASLSARLMAMNSASLVASEPASGDQGDGHAEVQVRTTPPACTEPTSPGRSSRLRVAAGLVAIAATIVAAIFLLSRPEADAPDQQPTVARNDPGPAENQSEPQPADLPNLRTGPESVPSLPLDGIVESKGVEHDEPEVTPSIPSVLPEMDPTAEQPVVDHPPIQISGPSDPPPDPGPPTITPPPRLADLRWVEVSGLLAQRNQPPEQSGSRSLPTWRRIQEGASYNSSAASDARSAKVALRTLPLSRAAGALETGGRLIIAGDTGLQITRGDASALAGLDLMYGSIALVGLSEGTELKLQRGSQTLATLRWQSKASAVVQRQTAGLQIQVDRGEIEINDVAVSGDAVQVMHDRSIETVPSPNRLPRWVTRPEESNGVQRMILAQLADTDDLGASLHQKITSLASSPQLSRDESVALATLAGWHAAMAGPNLLRLAGSRIPAVRLAAMQRLTQLSESDPRAQRTWNAIGRTVNNAQRVAQIRVWFRLVRSGSRPTAIQLEQMLGGLSSRDMASRALSDFILRQYIRNPPPFDPSWTGQTLQRAVNIYRQRAGVPIDRTRPNAAAANSF